MNKRKFLFLTLNVFSATGGIEKVCKIVAKAIEEISISNNQTCVVYAMHDSINSFDSRYLHPSNYKAFNKKKAIFSFQALKQGINTDIIILSHINLLLLGWLIKLINPKKKLYLFAHGIEVWGILPSWKKSMINKCDSVLCVSSYTKKIMVGLHKISETKCKVLNNCIDPYLDNLPKSKIGREWLAKYNINEKDFILFTISRLSAHDRDKGIDKVLLALKELVKQYPNVKYLIIGKYQVTEKRWLDDLIQNYSLEKNVFFVGYVSDTELIQYMNLGNAYIMPSKKEGFGIIFIEALFFGKPVIAGNVDGSVDALANGEFGILVNPDNNEEIINAIQSVILNTNKYIPNHDKVMEKFGYIQYKRSLQAIVE